MRYLRELTAFVLAAVALLSVVSVVLVAFILGGTSNHAACLRYEFTNWESGEIRLGRCITIKDTPQITIDPARSHEDGETEG